jgi:Reverse transcriptase (RNA-dependent DNA polymerase)
MKSNVVKLKPASLNWALRSAENFGDTSEFPLPLEYRAIRADWKNIRGYLSRQDILNWPTRRERSLLAPKSHFGFRVITQLDPLDFLVFAAVLYELAEDIEAKRLAVVEHTVFSFRFAPTAEGQMFDPLINYPAFLKRCRDISESGNYSHVVVADIADFYPRIYHHRLENALHTATRKNHHVRAVQKLLSGWNATESHGIPVGSAPTRLLAEITISDIDDILKANGIVFARFNDDYRLFAESKKSAYKQLFLLAESLYSNHGLQLQPQKTRVLSLAEFRRRYLTSLGETELQSLKDRFQELIQDLGIEDPYEQIRMEDLTSEQRDLISTMNLEVLFREEVSKNESADLTLLRFILLRMRQLANPSLVEPIFLNLEVLHPLISTIVRYFQSLVRLPMQQRQRIGEQLIDNVSASFIGELPHNRMWSFSLFSDGDDWNNAHRLVGLLNASSDQFSRRKLIFALGRSNQVAWFQSMRRHVFSETAWPRRALIAAASCMPADTYLHWIRPHMQKFDILEQAVVKWAQRNPFRSRDTRH